MMIYIKNVRGSPALMIAAIVVIGIMICGIYYLHKKNNDDDEDKSKDLLGVLPVIVMLFCCCLAEYLCRIIY